MLKSFIFPLEQKDKKTNPVSLVKLLYYLFACCFFPSLMTIYFYYKVTLCLARDSVTGDRIQFKSIQENS